MDGRFSVGDMADGFWSPHAPPVRLEDDAIVNAPSSSSTAISSSEMLEMGRSSSESAFQRFLQEAAPPDPNSTALQRNDVVEIKGNHPNHNFNPQQEIRPPPNNPIDSTEYLAFLRNRLELACAAVALTRVNNSKAQESAAATSDMGSQASDSSQYKVSLQDSLKVQHKHAGGPVGIPPLPAISTKSVAQVRSTTSGSSGEQSDDDAEGDTETTLNMDPADAKRMKRMLSNRESARRSRRRKQAHLTELETQVSQIRDENSSLLKRLSEINQKHNEAAVDNRVLKADVETLRAKVKMAEETVKRVTGLNPLFQAMPEMSPASIPGFGKSPDASAGAAVPVQDDQKRHYYHAPNSHISDDVIQNGLIDIPPIRNVRPKATVVGTTRDGRTVSSRE